MKHAWTGGQYSLWRALLAAVLLARFLGLAFSESTALGIGGEPALALHSVAVAIALAAALACAPLAVGVWHRSVASALVVAIVLVRDPRSDAGPLDAIVAAALLALCACTRPAPYLSLPALGRADPGGSWILPDWVYAWGWIVLAAVFANDVRPILERRAWPDGAPDSAEAWWRALGWILYLAPLALPRRATKLAWLAIVGVEALLVARGGSQSARPAEVVLAAGVAFDPGWIGPAAARAVDRVYYDGSCGLCHRFVRFLLAEDRRGNAFRFAPLDSESLRRRVAPEVRATLPDSIVVWTEDGRLLTRSRAIRRAAARLGGVWRCVSIVSGAVPTAVLDRLYEVVARVRQRLFVRPSEACPLVPAHLRSRFEDGPAGAREVA
jgi:predicted DCC family thiol-disulfide oxidoreductase YuxK